MTWSSFDQDGSGYGIYGQRYDASGAAAGEFRVNTVTSSDQFHPSVTALDGGGFVVTWGSADGSGYGVYGQRYDAPAHQYGLEFRVNTVTLSTQHFSSVAGLDGGGFVVTWSSVIPGRQRHWCLWPALRCIRSTGRVSNSVSTRSSQVTDLPRRSPPLRTAALLSTWTSLGRTAAAAAFMASVTTRRVSAVGGEFRQIPRRPSDQFIPRSRPSPTAALSCTGIRLVRMAATGASMASASTARVTRLAPNSGSTRPPRVTSYIESEYRQFLAGPTRQRRSGHGVWYGQPSASGHEVYARQFDLGTAQAVIGVRAENGDATTPVLTGVDAAIDGDFGTLTLHGDGSYSYQSNANAAPPARRTSSSTRSATATATCRPRR